VPSGPPNGAQMYNQYDQYGQPAGNQQPPGGPQLFEDTSGGGQYYGNQGYGYGNNQPQGTAPQPQVYNPYGNLPGTQIFQDPMVANMAVQYGQNLMGQGREIIDQKLEKYVSVSQIKYYFAVDTRYVMKKLQLLFFPFAHSDWSVRYNKDEPVQPRYEVNAPDLYIPLMALITYILVAGLCLGLQERFSPDVLGLQASSALVWLVLEVLLLLAILYIQAVASNMKSLDLLAFSAYKYVGMIIALLAGLVMGTFGYLSVLAYSSFTLVIFMFRTLRWQLQSGEGDYTAGNKRRLYLLLFMSGLQPVMMWWLTRHLVADSS